MSSCRSDEASQSVPATAMPELKKSLLECGAFLQRRGFADYQQLTGLDLNTPVSTSDRFFDRHGSFLDFDKHGESNDGSESQVQIITPRSSDTNPLDQRHSVAGGGRPSTSAPTHATPASHNSASPPAPAQTTHVNKLYQPDTSTLWPVGPRSILDALGPPPPSPELKSRFNEAYPRVLPRADLSQPHSPTPLNRPHSHSILPHATHRTALPALHTPATDPARRLLSSAPSTPPPPMPSLALGPRSGWSGSSLDDAVTPMHDNPLALEALEEQAREHARRAAELEEALHRAESENARLRAGLRERDARSAVLARKAGSGGVQERDRGRERSAAELWEALRRSEAENTRLRSELRANEARNEELLQRLRATGETVNALDAQLTLLQDALQDTQAGQDKYADALALTMRIVVEDQQFIGSLQKENFRLVQLLWERPRNPAGVEQAQAQLGAAGAPQAQEQHPEGRSRVGEGEPQGCRLAGAGQRSVQQCQEVVESLAMDKRQRDLDRLQLEEDKLKLEKQVGYLRGEIRIMQGTLLEIVQQQQQHRWYSYRDRDEDEDAGPDMQAALATADVALASDCGADVSQLDDQAGSSWHATEQQGARGRQVAHACAAPAMDAARRQAGQAAGSTAKDPGGASERLSGPLRQVGRASRCSVPASVP